VAGRLRSWASFDMAMGRLRHRHCGKTGSKLEPE
jgi:hypothetical protein